MQELPLSAAPEAALDVRLKLTEADYRHGGARNHGKVAALHQRWLLIALLHYKLRPPPTNRLLGSRICHRQQDGTVRPMLLARTDEVFD